MAVRKRKDHARHDWDSIAPIGARLIAAEAGNTFFAFGGKKSGGCGSAARGQANDMIRKLNSDSLRHGSKLS
ncbi:MAG TPA: hypothetical protein VLW52_12370 [Opitutaceae bacterium]|nr:hypothetical protein [Opitutaceae bacterium]